VLVIQLCRRLLDGRSKNIKRVAEYEKKLLNVQMHVERVTGDREVQVLNWS